MTVYTYEIFLEDKTEKYSSYDDEEIEYGFSSSYDPEMHSIYAVSTVSHTAARSNAIAMIAEMADHVNTTLAFIKTREYD